MRLVGAVVGEGELLGNGTIDARREGGLIVEIVGVRGGQVAF